MKITLIPGDGIGPEVSYAVKEIIDSVKSFDWEIAEAGESASNTSGELVPKSTYESLERNRIALKGPITTPIGKGFRSVNVSLRKKYDLYQNIRPIKDEVLGLDLVIFRENTEGLYIGEEKEISPDEMISIKRITRKGSVRIIRKAFEYAKTNGFKKLTLVHKANILKKTDGLFLDVGREIAKDYDIELEEVIVDNMCMQLVMNPQRFNVIVTMNLYGDILSDLCAGLVGGLGMVPGANIGDNMAIFEAVHGSAPDIAGKDIANPIALLRSGIMMLHYLGYEEEAIKIERAIKLTLKSVKTKDLGGEATLTEFTQAIIASIKE